MATAPLASTHPFPDQVIHINPLYHLLTTPTLMATAPLASTYLFPDRVTHIDPLPHSSMLPRPTSYLNNNNNSPPINGFHMWNQQWDPYDTGQAHPTQVTSFKACVGPPPLPPHTNIPILLAPAPLRSPICFQIGSLTLIHDGANPYQISLNPPPSRS